jgi:3'-phosphoadenosine 5'-phosphosulfate sulfotransferase (PAPS reductase)/FAD synthetase
MLHNVLLAYGGQLPEGVKVVFCNTGKERPETLDFVERCSLQWDVPIVWLEYRNEYGGCHSFAQVNYATASRKGEPFDQLIASRGCLPNSMVRFCTVELKIYTLIRYLKEALEWTKYRNAIGLRADEPKRVAKALAQSGRTVIESTLFGEQRHRVKGHRGVPSFETPLCPLSEAGATLADVMRFWGSQAFDLNLDQHEGNCDLCFLKSTPTLTAIIRDRPDLADWWVRKEAEAADLARLKTFRSRMPYSELLQIGTQRIDAPGWLWADRNEGACGEVEECRCTD